jgi:predicted secreted protein
MGIVTGIGVYFVVWWITLFMVLPWGNRPEEEVQEGNVPSAPAKPRLWLKAGITTVLAAIFWLIIWYVVQSDWIQLRDTGPL